MGLGSGVAAYIRRVKTSSGATAVQIAEKRAGQRRIVEHLGSAHDEAGLAVLMQRARDRLHAGQDELDLGLDTAAGPQVGRARLVSTQAGVLWQVLREAYAHLGFEVVGDEAFEAMVLARLVKPTSKARVPGVLEHLGVAAPHVNTLYAGLRRCQERGYRGLLAKACLAHSAKTSGYGVMVLYDVTTLHFDGVEEDELRKVGMSKEHRVDPQVQVGLLVDPGGFPLKVHLFEGNKAETTTIVPVLKQFQDRHGVRDMVVVADAGMLSAGNLLALEEAGFSFIVGSRMTKAPYDLADHFGRTGDPFTDGQVLESTRVMGTGGGARSRRIVYQWRFKRHKRDERVINLQIEKAEKVAAGKTPLKRTRFLKVTGATKALDQATIDRARQLAGLKAYVTNIPIEVMSGEEVIAAYHELWRVEASFRMVKSDLRARPVFHHQREAIEARLTVVFAALAITRYLTTTTGCSLTKIITTLEPLRSAVIMVNGHEIIADPTITHQALTILDQLPPASHRGH